MITFSREGVVRFRFFRPGLHSVSVVGDFNQWVLGKLPMHPVGRGWWEATATLPPGEYRFRYRGDDQWFTDFAANGVEYHRDQWNSVLVVPATRVAQPAAHAVVA